MKYIQCSLCVINDTCDAHVMLYTSYKLDMDLEKLFLLDMEFD